MTRYTRDEMLQKLRDLSEKPVVYKTEVDDAKYHLSRVYDAAKRGIGEAFTHAGQWEKLSKVENAIDLPYELRHLFGKKFIKSIDDAKAELGRSTPYIDAVGHMISDMSPLNTLMQALIERQVKGRRPVESTKKVIGTRTQLRAVCPICFRQHAIDGGRMVAHGYTLDYGFQNGTCYGHREPHFGTVEGRKVTENQITAINTQADNVQKNADAIEKDPTSATILDKGGFKIEAPTARDIYLHVEKLRSSVRSMRAYVTMLQGRVDAWKPCDPVKVQVDITE